MEIVQESAHRYLQALLAFLLRGDLDIDHRTFYEVGRRSFYGRTAAQSWRSCSGFRCTAAALPIHLILNWNLAPRRTTMDIQKDGLSSFADDVLSRRIVGAVQTQSRPFGTHVRSQRWYAQVAGL